MSSAAPPPTQGGPANPGTTDAAGTGPIAPHAEYSRRRATCQGEVSRHVRREQLVGNGRLAAAALGAVLAYFVLATDRVAAVWLLLPACLFLGLIVLHEQVRRGGLRARLALAYYERGLARLEGRWIGAGQSGDRFRDESHPYAQDLDLFGKGSLFELLSTARLRTGEDTLAAWLLAAAPPGEVRARQAAVAELRPRVDLRERLALLAAGVPPGVDLRGLVEWGAAPARPLPRGARAASFVLPVLAFVALFGWLTGGLTASPLLLIILLELAFMAWVGGRTHEVLAPLERRAHDLALFAGVLALVEREPCAAPRLSDLQRGLHVGGRPPAEQIARLRRLVELLDSRRNQLFAPFAFLLLWGTHIAVAVERWRQLSGPHIGQWLAAVGEFEALCALAAYAYENPGDPFPEVVAEGPCFEGEALRHPLLTLAQCVPNDVYLGGDLRLLVVSGSNMSGKSTFLRVLGINAVLALAGAPVRAARLRLSPLAVGATLRVQDSLLAGRSRFYAEITRVRQLVDLARGPFPLFFLLDELLSGTNSHDRRVGAEAVVRGLLDRGAAGLVTTHDLSLAEIADGLAPRAQNVHFADHFVNGAITFDFRLRPGVVRTSNGLDLMRAVGLEV